MTNNEIIESNYNLIKKICSNICKNKDLIDDLIQEIFIILLTTDNDKLNELVNNKELNFFVTRVVTNQWASKSSPFYRTYREHSNYLQIDNLTI